MEAKDDKISTNKGKNPISVYREGTTWSWKENEEKETVLGNMN